MQTPPLSYQEIGTGPDVVLLHGFLESPAIWQEFTKAMDGKFRSIIAHMPNHHANEEEHLSKDLQQQAKILHQTLLKTKVKNPVIIGHSLGGYLALAFIEKFPEFASGVALVNSSCLADSPEQKKRRTRAINLVEKHPNAFIHMAIRNLFAETYLEKHKTAIDQLINDAKKLSIPAIQASLIAMRDRKDTSEALRNFENKKLFIYGENDPLIPMEVSKTAIKKSDCPSISLNAGHMSWLEDKENLNKVLLRFLNK